MHQHVFGLRGCDGRREKRKQEDDNEFHGVPWLGRTLLTIVGRETKKPSNGDVAFGSGSCWDVFEKLSLPTCEVSVFEIGNSVFRGGKMKSNCTIEVGR